MGNSVCRVYMAYKAECEAYSVIRGIGNSERQEEREKKKTKACNHLLVRRSKLLFLSASVKRAHFLPRRRVGQWIPSSVTVTHAFQMSESLFLFISSFTLSDPRHSSCDFMHIEKESRSLCFQDEVQHCSAVKATTAQVNLG